MALRTVDSPMSKISKGRSLSKKRVAQLRKQPGGSNIGKYKNVSDKDFAGSKPGSFPINTVARANSALKLAHNDIKPARVKRKVYAKYPQLRPLTKRK